MILQVIWLNRIPTMDRSSTGLCPIQIHLYVLTVSSEASWPIKFVAEIAEEGNRRHSYHPRSDYLFSLNGCPHIIIDICSDAAHESDRYRLLLHAGVLVRTLNTIKTLGNSFVSVAIYISPSMYASWYLVYQPDLGSQVVGITNSLIIDHWSLFLSRSSIAKWGSSALNGRIIGLSSFIGSTISPSPYPSMI